MQLVVSWWGTLILRAGWDSRDLGSVSTDYARGLDSALNL